MKENIILTLDAGGTNLVFNAINSKYDVVATEIIPAPSADIVEFITKVKRGFSLLNEDLHSNAIAISFCFPGPADYHKGIIGDLENLPFFRGGVPLKDILEEEFKIPVFINNDGDLFTLGEAIGGLLPKINSDLIETGTSRRYKNLLGVTLGTGTGGGIVLNGALLTGDNSAGAEINRSNNYLDTSTSIEEILSIRGIKELFIKEAQIEREDCPEPGEIYKIATGEKPGHKEAALEAWSTFGTVLGHSIANAVTLVDGLVVLGGGLSGAAPLFLNQAVKTMNGKFIRNNGQSFPRLEVVAYNLDDKESYTEFMKNEDVAINVPGTSRNVTYSPVKKIGIGVTRLGTSEAVAVGAYSYAIKKV